MDEWAAHPRQRTLTAPSVGARLRAMLFSRRSKVGNRESQKQKHRPRAGSYKKMAGVMKKSYLQSSIGFQLPRRLHA